METISSCDSGWEINIRAEEEKNRLADAMIQMQSSFTIVYKRLKTLTLEINRDRRGEEADAHESKGEKT